LGGFRNQLQHGCRATTVLFGAGNAAASAMLCKLILMLEHRFPYNVHAA
jgi:hypothetical protein